MGERRGADGLTLDPRTLGRATLARQHLLARSELGVDQEIEHLVGMQSQIPTDPYIALWSRLAELDPEDLSRSMAERRAVRMTLMRGTIHLVTARDAPVAADPAAQAKYARVFSSLD